jgi:POT family proton-dependent oligopeptide transporter
VLLWASKKLYKAPPQGSVFYEACKVFAHCFKNGGWKNLFRRGDAFWDAAKPSNIEARQGSIDRTKVFWDDLFVEEIKQSVRACGVFFLIPIFLLADGGIGAMENTQSAAMKLDGVPNDVINNFNSIVIIVATPIMVSMDWLVRDAAV